MPAENVLEVHHLNKHVGQGEGQLTIGPVGAVFNPAQTIALIAIRFRQIHVTGISPAGRRPSGDVVLLGNPSVRLTRRPRARGENSACVSSVMLFRR